MNAQVFTPGMIVADQSNTLWEVERIVGNQLRVSNSTERKMLPFNSIRPATMEEERHFQPCPTPPDENDEEDDSQINPSTLFRDLEMTEE